MVAKVVKAAEAVAKIADGMVVAVNSSSGLCCPDAVLKALGDRFAGTQTPRDLTMIHPIAAGDMFGTPGVDHISEPGQIKVIIGGSYPSGPSNADPPKIWQRILAEDVAAYNVPSGIVFDMLREAAGKRPGVLTKVGLETFVDPSQQGCAMNATAAQNPIVFHREFDGEDWLYFPSIAPDVAIIRASTADGRGNLSFESEGATLGAMEMALAARNTGGLVIAQVKRVVEAGTLNAHDIRVPSNLVDLVVEAPEQLQTTSTAYDPAISGEEVRDLSSFDIPKLDPGKVIARRVAMELESGWAVNLGFGISANVPRIFLEEGRHGECTWVIEQGAVGGVPLLDFKFGCASNAEAFVASPHQFSYFQAAGFDAALLSFLQIGGDGSINVHCLPSMPYRTAGAGGFVDITARAEKLVFSGYFNAGAKMSVAGGRLRIDREGKIKKIVETVDQVSFCGPRAVRQGQDVTYVTERCVMKLTPDGLMVTEIAPGLEFERDIQAWSEVPLRRAPGCAEMDARLFREEAMGL